jgi:hypothetical protein
MRPWIDDPRATVARVDDDEEQRHTETWTVTEKIGRLTARTSGDGGDAGRTRKIGAHLLGVGWEATETTRCATGRWRGRRLAQRRGPSVPAGVRLSGDDLEAKKKAWRCSRGQGDAGARRGHAVEDPDDDTHGATATAT